MAHESTVEHSRLDVGETGTGLAAWLAQSGQSGQQVGGMGLECLLAVGMGVPVAASCAR